MRTIIDYKDYGSIYLKINQLMNERGITISKMVKLSGLHHNVVQRYYHNKTERYDTDVLAKFCYILECDISDVLFYLPSIK